MANLNVGDGDEGDDDDDNDDNDDDGDDGDDGESGIDPDADGSPDFGDSAFGATPGKKEGNWSHRDAQSPSSSRGARNGNSALSNSSGGYSAAVDTSSKNRPVKLWNVLDVCRKRMQLQVQENPPSKAIAQDAPRSSRRKRVAFRLAWAYKKTLQRGYANDRSSSSTPTSAVSSLDSQLRPSENGSDRQQHGIPSPGKLVSINDAILCTTANRHDSAQFTSTDHVEVVVATREATDLRMERTNLQACHSEVQAEDVHTNLVTANVCHDLSHFLGSGVRQTAQSETEIASVRPHPFSESSLQRATPSQAAIALPRDSVLFGTGYGHSTDPGPAQEVTLASPQVAASDETQMSTSSPSARRIGSAADLMDYFAQDTCSTYDRLEKRVQSLHGCLQADGPSHFASGKGSESLPSLDMSNDTLSSRRTHTKP